MSGRVVELGLWVGALASATLAYATWRDARVAAGERTLVAVPAPPTPRLLDGTALQRAADSVFGSDPFRLDRRPSDMPFAAAANAEPQMPSSQAVRAQPKPAVVLKGMIGGPPWAAVLEGVPGREGSVVVRQGDTVGGLTVRSLVRDTAVITGADTTWRLIVRRTWQ